MPKSFCFLNLIVPGSKSEYYCGLMVFQPRVDEKHATWLHLRIRSPHQPLAEVGKIGPSRTSPRVKHLVDGRWTLAFADAESCKNACQSIKEAIAEQSHSVSLIVASFLPKDAAMHE